MTALVSLLFITYALILLISGDSHGFLLAIIASAVVEMAMGRGERRAQ